ncbi:MAG: hypothetical protein GXY82_09245 [Methanospirillum sp.]|nr:hypothetical protein [Methanospirillum sp.]
MGVMRVCPECGRVYETVLEGRDCRRRIQAQYPREERWVREQLVSGLCSEECWTKHLGIDPNDPPLDDGAQSP